MTTGSPADGPCVPAFWQGSFSLAQDHAPETPTLAKLMPCRSGKGRWAGGGWGDLEKHPAAVFFEGKLFSVKFMTSSSNISSHKAALMMVFNLDSPFHLSNFEVK